MTSPITDALTLIPAENMDNWFVIERAEHEQRGWIEPIGPGSSAFRWSGRIGTADIEGSAGEMRDIAEAIRTRTQIAFKRCAVDARQDPVLLWSPRNSETRTRVARAVADALVVTMLEVLP